MNNRAELKRRISSVRQTRQITGAMETVSVAKMRKALEHLDNIKAYIDALDEAFCDAARCVLPEASPDTGKKLVIVAASDKGLCGSFDHDIFRFADGVIDGDTVVMPIGRTACGHYAGRTAIDMRFSGAAVSSEYGFSAELCDAVLGEYGKTISSASLVCMDFVSRAVWRPAAFALLPIEPPPEKPGAVTELYPSAREVFDRLLPAYITGRIFGALSGSVAAEHCARRAAMSASAKNADALISSLTTEYNRARQAAVTGQITEIVGSVQALGKGGRQ